MSYTPDARCVIGPGGLLCALMLCPTGNAQAQAIAVKPLADARLRYETFSQAGLPEDAHALTFRLRPGIEARRGALSAIVEGEATVGIVRRFDDGFNGRSGRPLIPDADNIELNRVQMRYDAGIGSITAGRQAIELADQRFVGSANFRQNQQTFDAVRVQTAPAPHVTVDISYAWSVRTPAGQQGRGARPQSIPGDNVFALVGYATPVGTLTAFTYIVDQNLPAIQGFRLESRTSGVRLAGTRPLGAGVKLAYAGSYARQRDHHANPNRYAADYYLAEATVSTVRLAATVGYEVLGASDGRPFTSFQTPDDSAFRFQGWAGRFLTTPADGIRDVYATIAPSWKVDGPVDAIGVGVTVHRFDSDRLRRHYGDEIDVLVTAGIGRTTLAARYADYRADRFATDVHRFWLSTEWSL